MEPVSTALAGIALVKSSVDFIKGNLDTVKDIGEIAGAIGNLLDAESQINKQRFQDTSLKDSAQHVIDAKLARENINEISMLIDLRFGPGTWQSILAERNKRIEENKKIENVQLDLEYIFYFFVSRKHVFSSFVRSQTFWVS